MAARCHLRSSLRRSAVLTGIPGAFAAMVKPVNSINIFSAVAFRVVGAVSTTSA